MKGTKWHILIIHESFHQQRIMAILRADDPKNIIPALEALIDSGIDTVEISWSPPTL
jgi:2-keto-3-deoxy-6-phosphogluconate aldolase